MPWLIAFINLSNWSAPAPNPGKKAARVAVERASQSLRDLRVAEVVELDMQITDGKVEAYRAKVKVSFKYEGQQ
jgi:flavin-binding protein dodecin